VIVADRVGVEFHFDRQRRMTTRTAARIRRHGVSTWGLRDISFSVRPGEGVALIGPSGSGKTTLLRILAGIYEPDEGHVTVTGRVASLLSVDAGLMGLLTGRENGQLLGTLGGLPYAQAVAVLDKVREESRLVDAFDRPVATFSQGMRARLSLSIADQTDPQILLLDEVHEALDHEFRDVLERRVDRILGSGGIVVAAGHDHPMLARICSRAILLRGGRMEGDGDFRAVQASYVLDP